MPRTKSFDEIITQALIPVLSRLSRRLENLLSARIEAELTRRKRAVSRKRKVRVAGRRRRPRVEMTHWAADKRARRVPKFVIEATGLDTKKKVIARFGPGATFERGKPLPRARPGDEVEPAGTQAMVQPKAPARVVRARPPIVRNAARAATVTA